MVKKTKFLFTKTKGKGKTRKVELVDNVREFVDNYELCYIFSLENSRTAIMKQLRTELRDSSRFVIGKNRVIQVALGRTDEEAYLPLANEFASKLNGNVGILFTNLKEKAIEKQLDAFVEYDFARAGTIASRRVEVNAGPIVDQPSSMLEQLRKLSLPVVLVKGVIHLERNHVICEVGDVLTGEQTAALKAFGVKLSEFRIRLLWRWAPKLGKKKNALTKLTNDDDDDDDIKEKKKA